MPKPERLLAGASHFATGQGMEMVKSAGGTLSGLDHQWNYVLGLPDPENPEIGLASFDFRSIWVNRDGKRFTREFGDPKTNLPALLHQPGKTYWSVFDADGVNQFSITLAGWENQREVYKLVFQSPGETTKAMTLENLARKAGISVPGVIEAVARYNKLVSQGTDVDFHTFDPQSSPRPHPIVKAPFYAVQFYPVTRKTMGGVKVDLRCRVLNHSGVPIPGLFAAGEVTGFGGINGKAALEGTFLGPSILMGRMAGREATRSLETKAPAVLTSLPSHLLSAGFGNDECVRCHDLVNEVKQNRPAWWHFEQAHKKVLSRRYKCAQCHQSFFPFNATKHKLDRVALTDTCIACHGIQPSHRQH
jgi:succinate dehydrogenase/fumarate reductase flavoprotein subunit